MESLSESFRALGDPTRLRLLRLLSQAPLNVSELVSLVGVAQSSVSHHLAKLRGLELIREDRQAGFTYYSLAVDATDQRWPLIRLAQEAEDPTGDRSRLTDLLRQREDRQALNERLLEPGQSWRVWSDALGALLPALEVVDFGCGTGELTASMAGWAKRVVAIDRNPVALEQARARVARDKRTNVLFLNEDLCDLSLESGSVDLVILSQSLHHVNDPQAALGEAHRLLRQGGRVVVLELMPHLESWVRERLGHAHLGFDPEALTHDLALGGFTALTQQTPPRDGASAFRVFLLTGVKQ